MGSHNGVGEGVTDVGVNVGVIVGVGPDVALSVGTGVGVGAVVSVGLGVILGAGESVSVGVSVGMGVPVSVGVTRNDSITSFAIPLRATQSVPTRTMGATTMMTFNATGSRPNHIHTPEIHESINPLPPDFPGSSGPIGGVSGGFLNSGSN